MIERIKKRDGRIIAFVPEKITRAIFLAANAVAKEDCQEADYEEAERLTDLVCANLNREFNNEVPGVEQVQDAVIRTLIEEGHVRTSEAYILYRNERSRIRDAKSRIMDAINEITNYETDDSDNDDINLREETATSLMYHYGSSVSKEFALTRVLKPSYAHAHEDGTIHIHNLDYLNMGTMDNCQIDLNKLFKGGFSSKQGYLREPQDIASYAALCAITLESNQDDQHGGQSIPAFDYYLAPGVKKTFRRLYIKNLNKAIALLSDNDVDMQETMHIIEAQSGCIPELEMDYRLTDELSSQLAHRFAFDAKTINKMLEFAYREARNETDRQTYQAMEGLIHNLNSLQTRAGGSNPLTSINFGTDCSAEGRMLNKNLLLAEEQGLGNKETPMYPVLIFKVKSGVNLKATDPNYDLLQLALRVSDKRLYPHYLFLDAEINERYYELNNPDSEVAMNVDHYRIVDNVVGAQSCVSRGNASTTTINLVRIGIKHGWSYNQYQFDKKAFYADLDGVIELCVSQLLERQMLQGSKKVKNFPFLMGQGVWRGSDNLNWDDRLEKEVNEAMLSVGFIGLNQCVRALINQSPCDSLNAQQLGIEIIKHMRMALDNACRKYGKNFGLYACDDVVIAKRLLAADCKLYGKITGVNDMEAYSGSYHCDNADFTNTDIINYEASYQKIINAGAMTQLISSQADKEELLQAALAKNIAYLSFK